MLHQLVNICKDHFCLNLVDSMLEEVILLGTEIYIGKFITGDAYAAHPA